MPGVTTLPVSSDARSGRFGDSAAVSVLALAWSSEEPSRIGEIALLPPAGQSQVLGRGEGNAGETRTCFSRQRPGTFIPGPPLSGAGLSRRQLVLTTIENDVGVECVGRCELRVNGVRCERAVLRPGDTLYLQRQLLLLCTRRAVFIPKGRYLAAASWGAFGEPDSYGIVGESPATWHLREQLAFVAKSGTHALLVGPTGTGKELAARAIHAMSVRAAKPFVARNAATLPAGLIDAELFGNARNYPNAGMPERPGLIGQADGGTLFLDEIAELPVEQQAHLLRVLDVGGEYQRLGESSARRSDFRLVGATNRDLSVLKPDLRARLTSVVELLPLSSRREDLPLLARHLLLRALQRSPEVAGRFVARDSTGHAYARFAPGFVDCALRDELPANTRQLEAALWKAMSEAQHDEIPAPSEWRRKPESVSPESSGRAGARPASERSADDIRAALAAVGGSVTKAAHFLGLPNRFALYRLMKKHEIGDEPSE